MARIKGPENGGSDSDEQFYRAPRGGRGAGAQSSAASGLDDGSEISPLDSRVVDLDTEDESKFLRAQKRVPVRRGVARKTANRLKIAVMILAGVCVVGGIAGSTYHYATHSWRFRINSSDNLEISGANHVPRGRILQVFGADLSRNVFLVPLAERKKAIEDIPWIESAAVMRLLPNRIAVKVTEREPVAFVQIGPRVDLIDSTGAIMPSESSRSDSRNPRYSFPVILGMTENDPLSTRAARMQIYTQLMREFDSGGSNYSKDVNEVDLSDPDDIKITVADSVGAVLIHLGSSSFLDRYKVYVGHVQEWRQQYPKLNSVDLRYDRQVIIDPDVRGMKVESPNAQAVPPQNAPPGSGIDVAPPANPQAHTKAASEPPPFSHKRRRR